MCISHPLDARVAALRAAVGCGRTYRRDAAWAWEVMPICAFRRALHTTLHTMHTTDTGPRFYKFNRSVFYKREDIEAWISEHYMLVEPKN